MVTKRVQNGRTGTRRSRKSPGAVGPSARLRRVAVLLILVAGYPSESLRASVYRCVTPEGATLYRQFGCPAGTRPVTDDRPSGALAGDFSVVESAPLTDAEKRQLQVLSRQSANANRARNRERETNRQLASANRQAARERCEEARARLAELRAARRKGYSAAEERRWDQEEARLQAVRRQDC